MGDVALSFLARRASLAFVAWSHRETRTGHHPRTQTRREDAAMNIGKIVREVEAKPLEQPDVAPLEPEIPTPADEPDHETSGTP
jgi:hypothetical protein